MTFAILVVSVGLLGVFGFTARRACSDWTFQMRVVRTLSVAAAYDVSGGPFDLQEVELVGARPCASSLSIRLVLVDRPGEVGVFVLEAPLGEMATRCAFWQDAGTPLLFSGDGLGGALVHGPDGCLIGRLAEWSDPQLVEPSLPW